MLQLLLTGGQSYEDLGSLLGLEPSRVRAQAREALRAMAGDDPDEHLDLTDYLLGQLDPVAAAATAHRLTEDADACELGRLLSTQLTVIAAPFVLRKEKSEAPGAGPQRKR